MYEYCHDHSFLTKDPRASELLTLLDYSFCVGCKVTYIPLKCDSQNTGPAWVDMVFFNGWHIFGTSKPADMMWYKAIGIKPDYIWCVTI